MGASWAPIRAPLGPHRCSLRESAFEASVGELSLGAHGDPGTGFTVSQVFALVASMWTQCAIVWSPHVCPEVLRGFRVSGLWVSRVPHGRPGVLVVHGVPGSTGSGFHVVASVPGSQVSAVSTLGALCVPTVSRLPGSVFPVSGFRLGLGSLCSSVPLCPLPGHGSGVPWFTVVSPCVAHLIVPDEVRPCAGACPLNILFVGAAYPLGAPGWAAPTCVNPLGATRVVSTVWHRWNRP